MHENRHDTPRRLDDGVVGRDVAYRPGNIVVAKVETGVGRVPGGGVVHGIDLLGPIHRSRQKYHGPRLGQHSHCPVALYVRALSLREFSRRWVHRVRCTDPVGVPVKTHLALRRSKRSYGRSGDGRGSLGGLPLKGRELLAERGR